jgi:hypothetical protein
MRGVKKFLQKSDGHHAIRVFELFKVFLCANSAIGSQLILPGGFLESKRQFVRARKSIGLKIPKAFPAKTDFVVLGFAEHFGDPKRSKAIKFRKLPARP